MSTPTEFRVKIVNVKPIGIGHNVPLETPESIEDSGVFYFRRDVLDQLPEYLSYVSKMRDADPESYSLYSKIGGTLLPEATLMATSLNDICVDGLPSFSCVMLSGSDVPTDDDGKVYARLLYLQKIKDPLVEGVQFSRGHVFRMTMFYADTKTNDGIAAPMRYHVAVHPDGSVKLLREISFSEKPMRSKRGSHAHRFYRIPVKSWNIPRMLRTIASENGRDVHQLAAKCFCLLASVAPKMKIGFQVRAHNGGPRAVFNIAAKRTPYFFKDRDLEVNENGRKKRVFHYVKGHMRIDGKFIEPHTRGLKSFVWNNYQINIGIPGLDMPDVRRFTSAGIVHASDAPTPTGYVDMDDAATNISNALERGRATR